MDLARWQTYSKTCFSVADLSSVSVVHHTLGWLSYQAQDETFQAEAKQKPQMRTRLSQTPFGPNYLPEHHHIPL